MDLDTVVAVAATAVVGIAQLGIILTSRPAGLREAVYVGAPAVAAVALLVFAWVEIVGP